MTYACPHCVYTGPTAGSVKAHITSSTSGDHEGESGPSYDDEELRQGDAATGQDDSEPDATEPAQDSAGGTDASGPPEPEGGCPECGADESFDPAEGLREAGIDPEGQELAEYDHGCYECSTEEEWVVWNE